MTATTSLGDPRLLERIRSKIAIDPETGCWVWQASKTTGGYGQVYYGGGPRRAHIVVYMLLGGSIPLGYDLDHLCHSESTDCPGGETCPHRACVNPAHLEPVTRRENLARGKDLVWMKRAALTKCRNGHPLSGANLTHDGEGRRCRTCCRKNNQTYKQRKRERVNAR